MTPLPGQYERDRRIARAQTEAKIVNSIEPRKLGARAAALAGTLMGSKVAGYFHPDSWSDGDRVLRGRIAKP